MSCVCTIPPAGKNGQDGKNGQNGVPGPPGPPGVPGTSPSTEIVNAFISFAQAGTTVGNGERFPFDTFNPLTSTTWASFNGTNFTFTLAPGTYSVELWIQLTVSMPSAPVPPGSYLTLLDYSIPPGVAIGFAQNLPSARGSVDTTDFPLGIFYKYPLVIPSGPSLPIAVGYVTDPGNVVTLLAQGPSSGSVRGSWIIERITSGI